MKKTNLFIRLFSIFIILFLSVSCSKNISMKKVSFFALDTLCDIKAKTENEEILQRAKDIIKKYDIKYDRYKKNSVITKFNKNNIIQDKVLYDIIKKYKKLDFTIKKYFKLTMKNVIDLWDFDGGGNIPSKMKLKKELKKMEKTDLKLKKKKVVKEGKSGLDLGGLMKGVLLDRISTLFDKNNINKYIINLGGDVAVKGENIKVGIKNPNGKGIITYIMLKGRQNIKIVTSGNYERYFEINNKRYHHILNPTTGYPARGIKSLTYISKEGFKADIYSTAIFAMDRKKALDYIKNLKKDGVLLIDKKNNFYKKNLREGKDEKGRLFYTYK